VSKNVSKQLSESLDCSAKIQSLLEFCACHFVRSFIVWFLRGVIPVDRLRFVRTHIAVRLKETCSTDEDVTTVLHEFTNTYLQIDGVFLLRLIAHNTNGITTTEVASAVFEQWIEHKDAHKEPTARMIDETSESTTSVGKTGRSGSINM